MLLPPAASPAVVRGRDLGAGAAARPAPARCVRRVGRAAAAPGERADGRSTSGRRPVGAATGARGSGDAAPPAGPAPNLRRLRPLGDPELVEVLELADDSELRQLHTLLHGEPHACGGCAVI